MDQEKITEEERLAGYYATITPDGKYTIKQVTGTLNKVACSHLKENTQLLDYSDNLTDELNSVFGTEFGKKHIALHDIERNLAQSKAVT